MGWKRRKFNIRKVDETVVYNASGDPAIRFLAVRGST